MAVRHIPLEKVFVKKNIRFDEDDGIGDLMESMEHYGQLQSIGVVPRGDRYEVVWGHRRLKAAQLRNEPTIEAKVLEGLSEGDIAILRLQENVHRKQLTTEEILAAADEIKRRKPELTDQQISRMLGKQPAYLAFHRSTIRARDWLISQGLNKRQLEAMTSDELSHLRARLLEQQGLARKQTRHKTRFERGDRVPETGFRVVNAKGPNVMIVCASGGVKSAVICALRRLSANWAGVGKRHPAKKRR